MAKVPAKVRKAEKAEMAAMRKGKSHAAAEKVEKSALRAKGRKS